MGTPRSKEAHTNNELEQTEKYYPYDFPSRYEGPLVCPSYMALNDEVINIVTAISNVIIIINLLQQDKSPNPT